MLTAHIWVDGVGDSTNTAGIQDALSGNFVDVELWGHGSSGSHAIDGVIKTWTPLGKVRWRELERITTQKRKDVRRGDGDLPMDTDQLKAFLKEQIGLEEKIVRMAKKSVKDTKNQLVKNLIQAIAIDSNKHALMLNAILARLESKTPFIEETKRDELGKDIKTHIELEAKAIQTYEELIPEMDDPGPKQVIKYILDDEKRHHRLLTQLYELVIEKETLTEEDLWDLTWKDVPWHGGPGG
jgi:rubrerythrin